MICCRFLLITITLLLIFVVSETKASDSTQDEAKIETVDVDERVEKTDPSAETNTGNSAVSDHTLNKNTENLVKDETDSNSEAPVNKPSGKVRVVTKEELALHDGKDGKTLWLSIMSEVYDVTAGAEYYGHDAPYQVFAGRDANVPFITGNFTPEEALKPLLELEPHQLSSVDHWRKFYVGEEKYPFIGVLEGDLYDKDGNPTELMKKVQERLEVARIEAEVKQKEREERIAKRRKEDEEKKRKAEEYKREKKRKKSKGALSSILGYFQISNDDEL